MSNIVPLQHWHYPTIVRVIMDVNAYYHIGIIGCPVERSSFQEFELRVIFKIESVDDWMNTPFRTWIDARRTLAEKVAARSDVLMRHEYHATLWPRHKVMMFADETRRREVLRLAGRA